MFEKKEVRVTLTKIQTKGEDKEVYDESSCYTTTR